MLITASELLIRTSLAFFNVEVYSYLRGELTLVEFEVYAHNWMFVLSRDVMKFLKKLMRMGVALVYGRTDAYDFTRFGFGDDNRFPLHEWLAESVKEGKLDVVPSRLTLVRKDLLSLNDGLYELIERPDDEKRGHVFIKSLGKYRLLISLIRRGINQ